MPNKKTKKFSQFVQENNIDRPVGLTNGMNAIDDNSGSGNAPADATYVIRTPSPDLPNAQVLDDLEPGMMSVDTDGNIKSHVIIGINGTNVINGDGSMDGPIYIDGGGGGSSTGVSAVINQPGHGFEGGEWLRVDENSALYVEALANTDENAEVIGMVTENIDVNTFRIQQSGKIESFSAINALIPWLGIIAAGKVLFLSETDSGEVSLSEPSALDTVSRPCVVCDGDDSGWIVPYRGLLNNTGEGGGGNTPNNPNIIHVHQPGHGFVVEDILRVSGSGTFTKALANTKANAQAVGMVIEWVDADNFVLQTEGFTNVVSGKVAAGTYYLSSTVPGQMTLIEPGAGNYSKPIFVALTAGSGFILEQRQLQSPTDSNIENVNQPGHGFAVENVVRVLAADTYTLAQANSLNNARAVGIVTKIVDANNFVLQTEGIADIFAGKTPGQTYWLSASTPGLLTDVEPSAPGEVSKPMLMPINATRGYILEQRPMLQPNANGGGGGGGGGLELLDSYTFVGGETEKIFEGIFTDDYIGYRFILENVLVGPGAPGAWGGPFMRFGIGSPAVIQTSSYYVPTCPSSYGMRAPLMWLNNYASSEGPLNLEFRANKLSSSEEGNFKYIGGFSGTCYLNSGSVSAGYYPGNAVGGASSVPNPAYSNVNPTEAITGYAWNPNVGLTAPPVTAVQFGCVENGIFIRGTIKIYGIRG